MTGDGELESGEWISAREAYEKWQRNEVLAVPPVLHALKTLAGGLTDDLVERFLSEPDAHRQPDAEDRVSAKLHLLSGAHADQAARDAHELLSDLHFK